MANDTTIKGINIAFGGDSTEFNKANSQVQADLKSNIAYGKQLDKALKLDPTSIEKIESALEQNEKTLKLAQQQADNYDKELQELKSIDLNTLTNEIKDTEQALEDSEKESNQLKIALKELNNATDLDTGSIEKLESELKQSEEQSSKLEETLKEQNATLKSLDISNMVKLETNTQKANNQVQQLENEQERLNSDLKAMETERYADLSRQTKSAAISTNSLTTEQVGYNSSTKLGSAITSEFSGIIGKATKLVNPYTATIVATTLALKSYSAETQKQADFTLNYANALDETTISTDALYDVSSQLSAVLGEDMATSMEIVSNDLRLFSGDLLKLNGI